jgi:glucose/arabinose dehydrogenase
VRRGALPAAFLVLVAGCSGAGPGGTGPPGTPAASSSPAPPSSAAPSAPDEPRLAREPGGPRVEVWATGLKVPWDLAHLPDGRMLVTERPGRVRLLEADGTVRKEPVAEVEVSARGEGGLLGIDLDPRFAEGQRFAYLYATTSNGMQLQRWRVGEDAVMERDAVVLDGIEAGEIHDSGRLRFGPDGNLYLATGEAGRGELAQDPDGLNGKVLRLTPEQYRGTTDTPAIVSLGHRNPQGLDWQPGSDRLVITDHGPSGFDGPSCCDEVDVVVEGGNYGWPEVFGDDHGRFVAPVKLWDRPPVAPSGAAFVSLPESSWTGSYVVATLRGRSLRRLMFDGDRVTDEQVLFEDEYGRLRAVVEGPDGALYVTTSNTDGRGDPGPDDDRVLRVVPPAA